MATYTYNGRNQLEDTVIENGLFAATRAYDGAGRLTGVSNGTLDITAYTLSPDGRRTGITRNGQTETYGYDAARQVETANYGGLSTTQSWTYDAAANRSSATTNGVTTSYFANAVNEYTSITGFPAAPTHDSNGNALNWNVRPGGLPSSSLVSCVLSWNIHNELTSATKSNGDTATYQYDALGRRTKREETIGGVPTSTWFLHNGWNVELEYEFGAYARRLTWGQDLSQSLQGAGGVGGLVMFEELPSGGGAPMPSFPTYDGNGNITAWVNASGTVIARQRYDAFGNIIEQTGTPPSRYGFSTKPIEMVTGFLYYGYRYYDPVTGRWPSRDPIGERGGVNLYGFVYNNPFGWLDYLGREPRPNGSVACAGCHGTADGSWSNIAGGEKPANIFQEVMPPAKPPAMYLSVEAGNGIGFGVTSVACCDENEDYNIFFYHKICRMIGSGVSVGLGHVTKFEGSNCKLERYEGFFIETAIGAAGVSIDFDKGADGVNDVGGSVGVGTPIKFAICYYQAIGPGIKIAGGCKCDRTGDDGLSKPLPNMQISDPYTMDDFTSR